MSASDLKLLIAELAAAGTATRAEASAWFFKTGKGEYGEGDRFLGVSVPATRKIALRYRHLAFPALEKLLASKIHEHRYAAVEILVAQFEAAQKVAEQTRIYRFYLAHTDRINNWDLVDTSAEYIVGAYLLSRPRAILYRLAKSKSLWERRIAIVSTFAFIYAGQTEDTFAIAQLLLDDKEDLIHKATGWALRVAGKEHRELLLAFLKEHYTRLPRTTLRYAIEHFSPAERRRFLAGNFE